MSLNSPNIRFKPSPLALSMALAFAQSAFAAEGGTPPAVQTAPVAQALAPEQRVVVTNNADAARQASTRFKQVVNTADLGRYGDSTVLDVLRRQPGIVVTGAAGSGKGEVRMRGLGGGYVRILVNGDPAPPNFTLDTLSPALVERIEISRVPSVADGTQAIAGVINIILKQATRNPPRQLNLGLGFTDGYWNPYASGSFGQSEGPVSWVLTGAAQHRQGDEHYHSDIEGYDQADGALSRRLDQLNHDSGGSVTLTPRINWKRDGGDTLNWQGYSSYYQYSSYGHDKTDYLEGPDTPFGDDRYISDGHRLTLRSSFVWNTKLGDITRLETKLGNTLGQKRHASTIRFYDAAGLQSHQQEIRSDEDNHGVSFVTTARISYTEGHTLTAGVDLRRDRRSATEANSLDGQSQLDLIGKHFDTSVYREALFAQDEWAVTPRLSSSLGVRWESFKIRNDNNLAQRNDYQRNIFTPIIQSVWKLPDTEKDQLRLALSRTWRAPELSDLSAMRNRVVSNTFSTPDSAGNPQLKPELATGIDLAYEHYLAEGGLVSATVFVRRIKDVMVTTRRLEDGRWVESPINDGDAVSRGLELEAKCKLSQLVVGAPAVNLRTNAAWYQSSVDAIPGPDNRLARQTPFSINMGADYNFSHQPITAGATFGFVKQGEVRVSTEEVRGTSNQRSLEVYGLYKFNPQMQVRVVAANLYRDGEHTSARFVGPSTWQTKDTSLGTFYTFRTLLEMKL